MLEEGDLDAPGFDYFVHSQAPFFKTNIDLGGYGGSSNSCPSVRIFCPSTVPGGGCSLDVNGLCLPACEMLMYCVCCLANSTCPCAGAATFAGQVRRSPCPPARCCRARALKQAPTPAQGDSCAQARSPQNAACVKLVSQIPSRPALTGGARMGPTQPGFKTQLFHTRRVLEI